MSQDSYTKRLYDFCLEYKFLFIFTGLYIVLREPIFEFWYKNIVLGFIDKIENSYWIDGVFIAIILFILLSFYLKISRGYKYSKDAFWISLVLLSILFYERFHGDFWAFENTHGFESLVYFDILFLIFGVGFIGFIANNYKKIIDSFGGKLHTVIEENNQGFYSDNPIKNEKDDDLGRKDFAKQIAEKLIHTKTENSSFAVGVVAEWGSGKSSFLNMIQEKLENEKDAIIVEFNPWLHNGTEFITQDFFKTLSKELKPYHSKLSHDINKYLQLLVDSKHKSIKSFAKPLQTLLFPTKTAKEEFDNINTIIKDLNKKIFIFIDDLDRLDKAEVVEVLRIIRNTANFGNTFFIVAYDKEYVLKAVKEINDKHENYLEKIFQLEVPLPKFDIKKIQLFLNKHLLPLIQDDNDLNNYSLQTSAVRTENNISRTFYSGYLNNLRDASRFLNTFIIIYEKFKTEIFIIDILNISLLKIKYLQIYNEIFSHPFPLLTLNTHNKSEYVFLDDKTNSFSSLDKQSILDERLNIEKNKILIKNLLFRIFPDENHLNKENLNSINRSEILFKYISSNQKIYSLSKEQFHMEFKSKNVEFYIQNWLNDGQLNNIIKHFNDYKYKTLDDFEHLIRGFHYLCIKEEKVINSFVEKINYNEDISSLFSSTENYSTFIKKYFKRYDMPYNINSKILKYIDNNKYSNILSEEQTIELRLAHIRRSYAENKLNQDFFDLINLFTNKENIIYSKLKPFIFKEFFQTPKNVTTEFLEFLIIKTSNKQTYHLKNDILKTVFVDLLDFERYLNNKSHLMKHDNKFLEFKKFYDKSKENSFNSIVYNFEYLNPGKLN
ncbi:P-loop NTPase fold protein [Aureivirga sp. CE67]|uniref:KAP family P-loop NTPase fold protein n=1 Tax=Aureivirga sp. CE67 TaxID=1788983 RepID=UPI0018C9D81A|nr:P-loop NTPase fold protein [Aureivirga sp. CE67]